ncbi:hypothetical protein HHK36_005074 [Tetracentron sinense]|uniref:RING-type E3 ubiquitin transferase n=1 Tax=Tetracentron sinense TaxID=13715 RepID=A0A835DM27_TETSI|nr:hypothetical protein HHK36_005074 [Tetracentron sinense]
MYLDDDDDVHDPPSQNDNRYNLNGKIMLTAIISLLLVVALVILLHIYARCILRRQARRRATIHRLSIGVAMAQVQSREPPNTGLDPSIIASLPVFRYNKTGMIDECAVCLSALEEEEMARLLPNCKHMFHVACIDKWLSSNSTCPICRTRAEPCSHPQAESGEPVAEVPTSAPPLESGNSTTTSSFRMVMIGRERPSKIIQPCGEEDGVGDVERQ